jgi:anti-anti-sigma regulatory factor
VPALPFVLARGEAILSGRPKGAELLAAVMPHLQEAPDPSATPLDFSGVSFIDVSCADELLNKLLRRLGSGELGGRYLFLQGANPSVAETIETVLRLRQLSVLARQGDEVVVLGELGRPMREALEVLLQHKVLTSSQLAAVLGKNTNIVCNRLNALQRQGLACRLPDGTAGGRRYSYVSIL